MKVRKVFICILLLVVITVTGISSSSVLKAENNYAVEILKKLYLYSAPNSDEDISYFDCALMVLACRDLQKTVLGTSGDSLITFSGSLTNDQAASVRDFFYSNEEYGMKKYFRGSVSALPPTFQKTQILTSESSVSAPVVYRTVLVCLGYVPGEDFKDTDEDAISFASKQGFNSDFMISGNSVSYSQFAEVIYEALFINVKGGDTLLKKLAAENASIKTAAENLGMFDTVSTSLPEFTGGSMVAGSYKEINGEYTECEVTYSKVTASNVSQYLTLLKSKGWLSLTSYRKSTSSGKSEYHYVFQKMINSSEYIAVIVYDDVSNSVRLWYAYK